jgi:hypothetical protein
MTYATIAEIAQNNALFQRLTAAAAEQGKTKPYNQWVADHAWDLAVTPGWAASWEYAEALGIADPGADDGVITDGMILAAVQPMDVPEAPDQALPVEGEPDQSLPEEPIEE